MADAKREPRPVDVAGLLKEDKCFLLAVIDSPVKAFNAYNIQLDDDSLDGLMAVAARVRLQAVEMLSEMAAKWDRSCNACNNCCC